MQGIGSPKPQGGLQAAWSRQQAQVLLDEPSGMQPAVLDFASAACFAMRNAHAKQARNEQQAAAAIYLRIDELQRACCGLAEGLGKVHVEATEDLVSGTVLFEKTAPTSRYAVHLELQDGSRHEALQFASRVMGAWQSYLLA